MERKKSKLKPIIITVIALLAALTIFGWIAGDDSEPTAQQEPSASAPPSEEPTTEAPTEEPAPEASEQPEAEATSEPASAAKKTSFSGTTLKGNDISFEILDDDSQTLLNDNGQSLGLVGAWGRLCSSAATMEQLEETGVLTQSPVNEDSYVWRSMKYAVSEGGHVPASELDSAVEALSAGSRVQIDGKNCIAVNTDMKWALDYDYDFVTVGQYVGSKELLNTVEIY
ncbi:hypothetical protein [Rothia nasimurium]|uniref:hypothetical protein n=1 Tax=Rothia nasimurium TaxID=85336 RepID=UPI001F46DF83|nr:hypothetical protein [Rothia nasimurium]